MYDDAHRLTHDEVETLLRAAQWAPSKGNTQPWALIVCVPGAPGHDRLVATLSRGNAGWVPRASVVFVIAIPELFYAVQVIYMRNNRVIPLLLVAVVWYTIITTVLSVAQYYIERYYGRGTNRGQTGARLFPRRNPEQPA